jgi:hypothetical protein
MYSLLNNAVVSFRKSVQVLVTRILERWKHRRDKFGLIDSGSHSAMSSPKRQLLIYKRCYKPPQFHDLEQWEPICPNGAYWRPPQDQSVTYGIVLDWIVGSSFYHERTNSIAGYLDMLSFFVFPQIAAGANGLIFQQDGATAHSAPTVCTDLEYILVDVSAG